MEFDLDDEQLDALKEELLFSHPQIEDIDGRGLVWPGDKESPAVETPLHKVERRQITVMFCDLVGSTALSEKLDPEDLRDLMMAYQKTAGEGIERFQGHVAQYLGDGLMVYFGWPVTHEDAAGQAVRTGLKLNSVTFRGRQESRGGRAVTSADRNRHRPGSRGRDRCG